MFIKNHPKNRRRKKMEEEEGKGEETQLLNKPGK